MFDVSSESSARQRIHMKLQALFSSKDKSKKLKCCLMQFLFSALRVKMYEHTSIFSSCFAEKCNFCDFSLYESLIDPMMCLAKKSFSLVKKFRIFKCILITSPASVL